MRVEGEQRDLLKRRQEEEKREAENEMYELLEQKYSEGAKAEEVKEEKTEEKLLTIALKEESERLG